MFFITYQVCKHGHLIEITLSLNPADFCELRTGKQEIGAGSCKDDASVAISESVE